MKWISNLNKPVTWNILIKFLICLNNVILASVLQFEYAYVRILEKQKKELNKKIEIQQDIIENYQKRK